MKTLRVACLYFGTDAQSGLLRVAEACLRWTPQIAVSDEAVFLEIGRCQKLYREEILGLKLKALAKRFECRFNMAFAGDASEALARSKWNAVNPKGELPIQALVDYYTPFGTDPETQTLVREMAATLRKLGIETVSDFLEMRARSLPSRFGRLGLLLHQRIREAATIPWPRFMPPERIVEKTQFEVSQSFQDLEPVFFSMKTIVDRAMARLRGRGERATSVRVRFLLERYSMLSSAECSRSWKLDLALPQGSAQGLMPVLRERLGFDLSQKPLPSPITDLEFEVLETAPGIGAQRDFFCARDEETEAWNSLVARLAEKLGKEGVFVAEPVERYLPEQAWVKQAEAVLPEDESPDESHGARRDVLPERPLRLLETPLPLLKKDGELFLEESTKSWRVQEAEGPEILSGEWWFRQFQRSYYRLATNTGEHLWVFQAAGSDTVYLHGYFD